MMEVVLLGLRGMGSLCICNNGEKQSFYAPKFKTPVESPSLSILIERISRSTMPQPINSFITELAQTYHSTPTACQPVHPPLQFYTSYPCLTRIMHVSSVYTAFHIYCTFFDCVFFNAFLSRLLFAASGPDSVSIT